MGQVSKMYDILNDENTCIYIGFIYTFLNNFN